MGHNCLSTPLGIDGGLAGNTDAVAIFFAGAEIVVRGTFDFSTAPTAAEPDGVHIGPQCRSPHLLHLGASINVDATS